MATYHSDHHPHKIAIVFIGDSDISRWPESFYPSHPAISPPPSYYTHAKGGALMQHLSKQILKSSREIEILPKTHSPSSSSWDDVIFVACAGENDVSHGKPIDATMASFEQAVEQIFALPSPQIEVQQEHRMQPPPTRMHLIFIGPKVEPWMTRDESDARKGYFQLSQRLEQTIANRQKQFGNSTEIYHSIHYIDCLIRFCGDTKDLSVFGGGAIADSVFFDCDELHLSEKGYAVLKDEVELILDHIVKSR